MTEISITTDINKFTLKSFFSNRIAYDEKNDVIKKTFNIPLNVKQTALQEFLVQYRSLLLDCKLISPLSADVSTLPVWNDLLFLQHDLKNLWLKPELSFTGKRIYQEELTKYAKLLDFIKTMDKDTKVQIRANERVIYTLPEMRNITTLMSSIADIMLAHFKRHSPAFGELTFRKETIDHAYIKNRVSNVENYPNELTDQQITATVVRDILSYVRYNNLLTSKSKRIGVMTENEGRFVQRFVTLFGLDTKYHYIDLREPSDYTAFSNTLRSNLRKLESIKNLTGK